MFLKTCIAVKFCVLVLALACFFSAGVLQGQIFITTFNNAGSWIDLEPTGWTGYNPKAYAEGAWYFHSDETVRGTLGQQETYDGSAYAFRDRGIFTVTNTDAVEGIAGFSLQLRDWMLGSGEQRHLSISLDGGTTWNTIETINKSWFAEYQVYQEFVHMFASPQDFAAEEFQLEIINGGYTNNGRINIGQFAVLDQVTFSANWTLFH